MLLSYIFGPSLVKYDILSSNRRSKLHAGIDCLFLSIRFILQENMANDPNTYSFSSSSVMSYSSDGHGQPKYFQATKSTKKAPGGVGIAVPVFDTTFDQQPCFF